MAAYINLNAVWAGLVRDAAEYPRCGYGEAKAGKRKAQRGICRVVEKPVNGWETSQVAEVYAELLGSRQEFSKGPISKNKFRRSATSRLQDLQGRAEGEALGVAELVRQWVRLFREAMMLGSKAFVDEVFQIERSKFGLMRKEVARRGSECESALDTMKRVRCWDGWLDSKTPPGKKIQVILFAIRHSSSFKPPLPLHVHGQHAPALQKQFPSRRISSR